LETLLAQEKQQQQKTLSKVGGDYDKASQTNPLNAGDLPDGNGSALYILCSAFCIICS
jgi:hypothetical protein